MPPLSEADVNARLKTVPQWRREGDSIVRTYKRKDFADAIAFVNRVANAAEQADHHPDIAIAYNVVTMMLSTHSEGGLTDRDFALATRIDREADGG